MSKTALLSELLHAFPLLSPPQLREFDRLCAGEVPPEEVARETVRRNWLTPLQVRWLLRGRGSRLTLGPYVLLDRLGRGGMGQVFRARHRLMGRLAAVKVMRSDRQQCLQSAKRFLREMRAVARLDHPNVVHAYDAGVTDWACFLAMEYIHGPNLARVVEDGLIPPGVACEYARQSAVGLTHLHERGLVHRDIKPSNLALAPRTGAVKILDIGLARLKGWDDDDGQADLTRAGALLGTADYLAPEQVKDARKAGHRSDLYSLGCTLYHLLTGQVPFPEGNSVQKALRHLTEEPRPVEELRPGLPQGLPEVVRKLMAKRRRDRYQAADEAAAALAPFSQRVGPEVVAGYSGWLVPGGKSSETLSQCSPLGVSETGSHAALGPGDDASGYKSS